MKKLTFLLTAALPLAAIAQDSAVVIDESFVEANSPETIIDEIDNASAELSDKIEDSAETATDSIDGIASKLGLDLSEEPKPSEPSDSASEPAEVDADSTITEIDILSETQATAIVPEELPEQPDDIKLPEPTDPVVIKIEIPKQIDLAKGQSESFQLLTPWAPKPMQQPPLGWRYTPVSTDYSYPLEVKLSTGKTLTIDVTPYALVPEASKQVIQATEPGYQPTLGYQQTHSVSARLENTTDNLKGAASSLNTSIENLTTLLDSLPKL